MAQLSYVQTSMVTLGCKLWVNLGLKVKPLPIDPLLSMLPINLSSESTSVSGSELG